MDVPTLDREEIFSTVRTAVSRVFEVEEAQLFPHTQLCSLGANEEREKRMELVFNALLKGHGVPKPPRKELRTQLRQPSLNGLCNYVYCQLRKQTQIAPISSDANKSPLPRNPSSTIYARFRQAVRTCFGSGMFGLG